ncbi:acetylxylan esterase [Thermomonospora umbrina]|uniref:poly(ethylene terephthalate) hydrolase n=1 Tax=Thermomonospora umbrina TaxID=111806 RepID=A0A3D9SN04_9ACTN|nr:acetylxylan esterase [Thermomonospora umbrina]REE97312.1 chlorophyllase-like protein [Thermomonospora umbrina]
MPRFARIAVLVAAPLLAVPVVANALTSPASATAARTAAGAAVPADWSAPGPYAVTVDKATNHTIYRPSTLAANGVPNPVVIWGNGTGATPAAYDGMLRHWASQGFVVAAANTTQSNDGTDMREGLDVLAKRNGNASSPYYRKVDLSKVVSAGHSQGGAGALNAAQYDSRVDAVLPIQPGPLATPGWVRQPTFYMSGQNDDIVQPSWVLGDYNGSGNRPAIYGEVRGANHFAPAGDGGVFRGPTTAWLHFMLRDDPAARAAFAGPDCGYCGDTQLFSKWLRNTKFTAAYN